MRAVSIFGMLYKLKSEPHRVHRKYSMGKKTDTWHSKMWSESWFRNGTAFWLSWLFYIIVEEINLFHRQMSVFLRLWGELYPWGTSWRFRFSRSCHPTRVLTFLGRVQWAFKFARLWMSLDKVAGAAENTHLKVVCCFPVNKTVKFSV